MDELLRWLASWRGLEPEPGTELQLELANFPTGGFALLVLLGAALAVVAVVAVYRRDGRRLTTTQRAVLASLRAIAVLAVLVLLLEPNLVTVERETRAGHTILLADTSQSMTHVDAWRRDDVRIAADGWRALGVADPAAAPRLALLTALLAHDDGALLRALAAKNVVQPYSFAGTLDQLPLLPPTPAAAGEPREPLSAPVPRLDLAKLTADGRATNLGGALRTALDKSRTAEIAAVVVLTDGRRNAGPHAAEIARLLAQRKIPHTFVLGIGDPSETQTVELTRFEAPAKVFQRDPFALQATIVATGHDPTTITARLVRVAADGGEEVVRTQQVDVGGDRTEVDVAWPDVTADVAGRFVFRTEIEPPAGEPVVAERHVRAAPVEVLGETLRLLLVAGSANHEFQILRNLLIRDKTIDVSCWLQSADERFPQDGDEGHRIDTLPESLADLDPYDVVVLIDPDAGKLSPRFAQSLQQHVVDGGCGLWWVAGEKFSLDAMRPQAATFPLAELLPIVPDVDAAERSLGLGKAFKWPWRFELAADGDDGLGAKLTRIGDGGGDSRLLWSGLPGARFVFPVLRAKPVATVLVEHGGTERGGGGGGGMPVLAMQNVGAGRVVFSGFDETYRWRSLHEQAYNRFWVNGVRYLFEGRVQAGNSRLRLFVSDDRIDLGDALELTATAKDPALQPWIAASFPVVVERDGGAPETLQLAPAEGAPGSYSARLRPDRLGSYHVRPAETFGDGVEARFQVVAAQIERHGPADRAELAALVAVPGGELFDTPQALLAALERIPSRSSTDTFRTPHPLWDGWPTILFVLLVLSLEWLLRKRFNLL